MKRLTAEHKKRIVEMHQLTCPALGKPGTERKVSWLQVEDFVLIRITNIWGFTFYCPGAYGQWMMKEFRTLDEALLQAVVWKNTGQLLSKDLINKLLYPYMETMPAGILVPHPADPGPTDHWPPEP